jgi:hypothetical protein
MSWYKVHLVEAPRKAVIYLPMEEGDDLLPPEELETLLYDGIEEQDAAGRIPWEYEGFGELEMVDFEIVPEKGD